MYNKYVGTVFFVFIALTSAKIGDILWSKCGDLHVSVFSLNDACVSFIEAEDCSLNVSLSIGGSEVFRKSLEVGIVPQVCGDYTIPNLNSKCNICAKIKENAQNSSEQCLAVDAVCSGIPIPENIIGCFPESTFTSILNCRDHICLNKCTNHGDCIQGKCNCYSGWFGSDCSSQEPLYEQCVQVSELAGTVCARVKFTSDCQVSSGIYFDGFPLVNREFPVSEYKQIFSQSLCINAYDCNTCLKWNDLVLNSTEASGCGSLTFTCFGQDYGRYDIQCFEDHNLIAKCFGSCPNMCSFNGICNLGSCICNSEYRGDDCSIPVTNDCNIGCIHGYCSSKKCICDDNYSGDDCSQYINSENGGSTKKGGSGSGIAMVVVPIVVIIVVLAAISVFYKFRQRTKEEVKFRQLDLIEEEQSTVTLDDKEKEEQD